MKGTETRTTMGLKAAVRVTTIIVLAGFLVLGVLTYREMARAVDAVDRTADAAVDTASTATAKIEFLHSEVERSIDEVEAFCEDVAQDTADLDQHSAPQAPVSSDALSDAADGCGLYLRIFMAPTTTSVAPTTSIGVEDSAPAKSIGTVTTTSVNPRICTHDGRGHANLGYNPGTHTHPTNHTHASGKCAGV